MGLVNAVQARLLYAGFGETEMTHSSGTTTIAVQPDPGRSEEFETLVLQFDPDARRVG